MPKRNVAEEEAVAVVEEDEDLLPDAPVTFAKMPMTATADEETESALATYDGGTYDGPSEVAVSGSGGFNFDANPDFDQSDLSLARLRLIQGISKEVADGVARPGEWVLRGHDPMKSVVFIPVGMTKTREYRAKDNWMQVLCQSPDSKVGHGEPGGACQTCPMSQWIPSTNGGKNSPPPCTLIYNYLGYLPDLDEICTVSFSKTQVDAAKFINNIAATRRGFGRFAIELASTQKKGPQATVWVPAPTITQVEPSMFQKALETATFG